MTETQTVDLAVWLTAVWDEDTRRFGGHDEDCDEQFGRPCDCIFGEMLARIAADRKILAEHRAEEVVSIEPETRGRAFLVCRRCRTGERQLVWPCTTARLLAEPYQDRPGFRPEWLVERQGVEQP